MSLLASRCIMPNEQRQSFCKQVPPSFTNSLPTRGEIEQRKVATMDQVFEFVFFVAIAVVVGVGLIAGLVFSVFAFGPNALSGQNKQNERRQVPSLHTGSPSSSR